MPTDSKVVSKAAAKAASGKASQAVPESAAAGLRYCCQPVQHPRQFDPAVDVLRSRAILAGGKKWVNGTQLTYCCYKAGHAVANAWKGKASDIEEVRQAFAAWFKLGIGISFKELAEPEDAMLRIGFAPGDGSWSYVGRDNLGIRDPLQRTMNFGWALNTAYGRDTALHEIGHALAACRTFPAPDPNML